MDPISRQVLDIQRGVLQAFGSKIQAVWRVASFERHFKCELMESRINPRARGGHYVEYSERAKRLSQAPVHARTREQTKHAAVAQEVPCTLCAVRDNVQGRQWKDTVQRVVKTGVTGLCSSKGS